jgi:hypothetical protein
MPNYGNSNLKVSDAITVAEVGGTPDAYPTHYAFLGKGGWRSAASLSTLNSTSSLRLEAGCAGYVWNDGTSSNNGLYVYDGSAWVKTSLSPTAYSLPIASASVLGGVRIPSGGPISINSGNGDLSLRVATTSVTGIVRVGSGLSIDGSGVLSVSAADLTVINSDGSYSNSHPNLRFKGSGITSIAEDLTNDENVVTIDAPTATVGATAGAFSNIVFAGSGGIGVSGSYNSGTKTYTVTYSITSSGTLKQNLYELDDVDATTVTTPNNGDMLLFNGATWEATPYTAGIALTDISATTPVGYTINSGKAVISMSAANSSTNGYLSSADWSTFNNKQAALVSGTNIKTINGTSLLGSGNIVISGGGGGTVTSVAVTTNTSGTDVSSTVTNSTTAVEITLSIPTASSSNRGVITSAQFDTFNTVTNKLNIAAGASSPSGTTLTLDFSLTDTVYGTAASALTHTTINMSTTSAKVGVTHIVVHNSSTAPTINSALKLSGSGNYKPSVNNYIYFTYISGTTVIYSINQA